MRKLFTLATAFLIGTGITNSQEAFKHLSIGVEAATTGIGLELALPIVSDHLVLAAGYNFGNFSANLKGNNTVNLNDFSGEINTYVNDANNFLSMIPEESERLVTMPASSKINGSGSVRISSFKAVLEYYPAKKSNFHINAGVFIGNADVISLDGNCPDYWNAYSTNVTISTKMASKYPEFAEHMGKIPEPKASINGTTYQIKEPGDINIALKAAKVRPYLGLGFGRSVPNSHLGFQFDLGAIYTGKIGISSTNEVGKSSTITNNNKALQTIADLAEKICVYPQLSFRLIYRIF